MFSSKSIPTQHLWIRTTLYMQHARLWKASQFYWVYYTFLKTIHIVWDCMIRIRNSIWSLASLYRSLHTQLHIIITWEFQPLSKLQFFTVTFAVLNSLQINSKLESMPHSLDTRLRCNWVLSIYNDWPQLLSHSLH